jgi:hypothetical protein
MVNGGGLDADTTLMTTAQRSLRQLLRQDMYVLDERAIAAAIIARTIAHATVARAAFHSDPPVTVTAKLPSRR